MRLLDQPDDLQLLGCGISHSSSPPSAIMLFLSRRFSRARSATRTFMSRTSRRSSLTSGGLCATTVEFQCEWRHPLNLLSSKAFAFRTSSLSFTGHSRRRTLRIREICENPSITASAIPSKLPLWYASTSTTDGGGGNFLSSKYVATRKNKTVKKIPNPKSFSTTAELIASLVRGRQSFSAA